MPNAALAREKFRTTLKRWRLLEPEEPVLVAVSGGVDSVVLLHLLNSMPPRERPRLCVAHYDHRLRRASASDARFVASLCRRFGVPCVVGHAPVWKNRNNLEARARALRYRFLEMTAQKRKIEKILTAHHADDQAETFLMRWIQGAGLRGLGGMSLSKPLADDGKIWLVRPLLLISRGEIEDYAKGQGIDFRDDETNRSALFLRTRLRRLMKYFREENPNIQNLTALNALTLQADEAYLEKVSREIWKQKGMHRKEKALFPLKDFRGFPESLRYRLLQSMTKRLKGEVYALPLETVLKLDDILVGKDSPARYDLPSGLGFFKQKARFEIFKKPC